MGIFFFKYIKFFEEKYSKFENQGKKSGGIEICKSIKLKLVDW